MNYRVAFDVTDSAPEWSFTVVGLLFMAIGVALWLARNQTSWFLWQGPLRTRPGLRKVLCNFHPMPRSGHGYERFEVGGVRFEYSDYEVTPGFRQTSSHGGPIRAGLNVRIHYFVSLGRSAILKLEIQE